MGYKPSSSEMRLSIGSLRVRYNGYVWRIDEIVTKDGLYITWDGAFTSEESARLHIQSKGYQNETV